MHDEISFSLLPTCIVGLYSRLSIYYLDRIVDQYVHTKMAAACSKQILLLVCSRGISLTHYYILSVLVRSLVFRLPSCRQTLDPLTSI